MSRPPETPRSARVAWLAAAIGTGGGLVAAAAPRTLVAAVVVVVVVTAVLSRRAWR